MRITLAIAVAVLTQATLLLPAQTSPSNDSVDDHLHFQRAILLPSSQADRDAPQIHRVAPQNAPACAVLPPEVFHHAAPALRDLRVLSNGQEVPYTQEVSYDQQSLSTGITLQSDRSLYETVETSALTPTESNTSTAQFLLPARVPVERLAFSNPINHQTNLQIKAAIAENPTLTEQVRAAIKPGESSLPITLGANLQHDVNVTLIATPQLPSGTKAVLQMRRRSICFDTQNASSTPTLTYGDSSLTAPAYRLPPVDFLKRTQEATLGPLIAVQTPSLQADSRLARLRRPLLFVIGAELVLLPLFALWLLSRYRRTHPPKR